MKRYEKIFENAQFVVLALLILGQCTVGSVYLVGQGVYLLANLISVVRCFVLKRPVADKVKDICCLAITLGLIFLKFFVIKS